MELWYKVNLTLLVLTVAYAIYTRLVTSEKERTLSSIGLEDKKTSDRYFRLGLLFIVTAVSWVCYFLVNIWV